MALRTKWTLRMVLALGLALPATALAQATPQEKCAAAKMRAVGGSVAARLGCLARANVNVDFEDDVCLEKAQAKLTRAFLKAQDKWECDTEDDAADFEVEIQGFVETVENDLTP